MSSRGDHRPRRGSLAFTPRKRAKKQTPRIHSWPQADTRVLGFAGYKAGMTHVMAKKIVKEKIRARDTPTADLDLSIPVTVIEVPPVVVYGVRFYEMGYFDMRVTTDIIVNTGKNIDKRINLKDISPGEVEERFKSAEDNLENIKKISLLVHTQPAYLSFPKKTPDVMEIPIGGDDIKENFAYARDVLGKEINVSEVFREMSYVDVTSVTKGKGFQGSVKRWGLIVHSRKSTGKRRHMGSGGSWKPSRKHWSEPQAGQMGYHTRTEFNKAIIKIGKDGKEVTPDGGFLRYGPVNTEYILLKGSVPGPVKRIIRLSFPRRIPNYPPNYEVSYVSTKSKQGN